MVVIDPATESLMVDDLLNFSSDIGDDENDDIDIKPSSSSLVSPPNPNFIQDPDHHCPSLPELEELEWLSNKEAFPAVETCFGILSDNPDIIMTHESPVSVLENSNGPLAVLDNSSGSSNSNSNISTMTSCCGSVQVPVGHPVGLRSKRRPRRRRGFPELPGQQYWRWSKTNVKNEKQDSPTLLPQSLALNYPLLRVPPRQSLRPQSNTSIGRRCQHCLAEKTPQWRAGPMGPKTLCNACGVRYKSGRLVPEYRPASSPTFSNTVHSNSHRKIMEMRKVKQLQQVGEGVGLDDLCGYRVV